MSVLKEFRDFALRGNVLDLAIGIIIGGAFGHITTSLVADILMPPLGAILQGSNFATLAITLIPAEGEKAAVTINYGNFLQTVIDFILIAFVIFSIVKVKNRLMVAATKREAEEQATIDAANASAEPAEPTPTAQEQLLSEIRDLLKSQAPTKY